MNKTDKKSAVTQIEAYIKYVDDYVKYNNKRELNESEMDCFNEYLGGMMSLANNLGLISKEEFIDLRIKFKEACGIKD